MCPLLCCEIEDADFSLYGGPYANSYWLETGAELIPVFGAGSVGWENWSRIAFVRDGKLFVATLEGDGQRENMLFDFNPLKPCKLAAPGWAQR